MLLYRLPFLLLLGTLTTSLIWAKKAALKEQEFWSHLHAQSIEVPSTSPRPGTKAIETAMAIFGIESKSHIQSPIYDPHIYDRGTTIKGTLSNTAYVSIGAAAFESWGILGSTLAHEIEIHGNQDFIAITLLDILGFDATGEAERVAYSFEIDEHQRFDLSQIEVASIESTMNFYFPEDAEKAPESEPLLAAVRSWLTAKLLAHPHSD